MGELRSFGRRGWVLLLVTVCIAAACSSDPQVGGVGGPSSAPSDAGTAVSEPGTAAPDGADSGEPFPAPGEGSPQTPAPGPPSSAVGPSSSSTTTAAVAVPAVGVVGAYGPWYLGTAGAESVTLEVRSQSGAEPTGATVDRVRSVLAEVSGKTVSTVGGEVPGGARQWTPDDIRAEADRTGPAQRSDAAVLTLLFLRGGLAGSDSTIGVAVRSDVAAVFSDRVDDAAGLLATSDRIELAVTTHEVGHLLGLVDLVLATGRQDPEHPGHSPNRSSVMYYAVESTLVGDILGGGPPTEFDDADRADLRAIAARSS